MHAGVLHDNTRWLIHALGPTGNPLRRWVDRLAAAAILVVLAVMLLAVPVAGTVGNVIYERNAAEAERTAMVRHQVAAVVVDPPRNRLLGTDPHYQTQVISAPVRWTEPDGRVFTADARVAGTTAVGSVLVVWVGPDHQVTTSPPQEHEVRLAAATWAVALLLLWESGGVVLLYAVRLVADLCAANAWRREWEIVQPRWTREWP